jgi:hypothetical protein
MGEGAPANKSGDDIFILHGGQVPYIMRSAKEDDQEFIRECYVHRMMYLEALQFEGIVGCKGKVWHISGQEDLSASGPLL